MPIIYIHSGYLTNAVVKCLVSELNNVVQGPTAGQGQISSQEPVLLTPHRSIPVHSGHIGGMHLAICPCRLPVGQRPDSWRIPHFRAVAVAMAMTAFPNLRLPSRDLKLSSSGLNAREHPAGGGEQNIS